MEKKDIKLGACIMLICVLLSGSLAMIAGALHYADSQYDILSNLAQKLISRYPNDEQSIIRMIKENSDIYHRVQSDKDNYLSLYGYEVKDFAIGYLKKMLPVVIMAASLAIGLVFALFYLVKKNERERIEVLTRYLERLNMGREVSILPNKEDPFSGLQDEIYKTVTMLYKTREEAVAAKKNYADNLANIAHQMKTPLTSMSLMTQLIKADRKEEYVEQLQKQIERLTKLEEALLLLSRIDAGVLELEKENVDVYTILRLSVEGLEELPIAKALEIKLENRGAVSYMGDKEWSIEAFTNLIKNCMEYAKNGITIEYIQNPIYTEIKVWDDGAGFAEQDLPHIFERFYRGGRAKEGGIGIGLALAKSLIAMQNGCVEAKNLPAGGACFAVRFYCH
ncbi:sensor histidine kinase [Anaerocolumna xylanovorans]|uniref:histidine kinase n=1 Tax=Anaerocolumna xylanovorans DSM 12503 TaxID=1121345 RepID=A0A1M7XYF7_9FIRM|nr:HAMP domain-containing sensor histidine kinase [Anaerocolumna xylanovorans]SHO43855.1 Signal transduction histidine kinase [Anaerocolumna xylanovorans DSM 12503]